VASEFKPCRITGGTGAGDIARSKALFAIYEKLYQGMGVPNWRKIVDAPDGTRYLFEGGEIINRILIVEPILRVPVVEEEARVIPSIISYIGVVFFHDGTDVYMKPVNITADGITSGGETVLASDKSFTMAAGFTNNAFYQRLFNISGIDCYLVNIPFQLTSTKFSDGGVWSANQHLYVYNPKTITWAPIDFAALMGGVDTKVMSWNYSDDYLYVVLSRGSTIKAFAFSYNGTALTLAASATIPATVTVSSVSYAVDTLHAGITSDGAVILYVLRSPFPATPYSEEGLTVKWDFDPASPGWAPASTITSLGVCHTQTITNLAIGGINYQLIITEHWPPWQVDKGTSGIDALVEPSSRYKSTVYDVSPFNYFDVTNGSYGMSRDEEYIYPGPMVGSTKFTQWEKCLTDSGGALIPSGTSYLITTRIDAGQSVLYAASFYTNFGGKYLPWPLIGQPKAAYQAPFEAYNGSATSTYRYSAKGTHDENYRWSSGGMHEAEVIGRDALRSQFCWDYEVNDSSLGEWYNEALNGNATLLYNPRTNLLFSWHRYVDYPLPVVDPPFPDSSYHGVGYVGTTRIEETMATIIGQDANKVLGILIEVPSEAGR
jgi:hypothetical protein